MDDFIMTWQWPRSGIIPYLFVTYCVYAWCYLYVWPDNDINAEDAQLAGSTTLEKYLKQDKRVCIGILKDVNVFPQYVSKDANVLRKAANEVFDMDCWTVEKPAKAQDRDYFDAIYGKDEISVLHVMVYVAGLEKKVADNLSFFLDSGFVVPQKDNKGRLASEMSKRWEIDRIADGDGEFAEYSLEKSVPKLYKKLIEAESYPKYKNLIVALESMGIQKKNLFPYAQALFSMQYEKSEHLLQISEQELITAGITESDVLLIKKPKELNALISIITALGISEGDAVKYATSLLTRFKTIERLNDLLEEDIIKQIGITGRHARVLLQSKGKFKFHENNEENAIPKEWFWALFSHDGSTIGSKQQIVQLQQYLWKEKKIKVWLDSPQDGGALNRCEETDYLDGMIKKAINSSKFFVAFLTKKYQHTVLGDVLEGNNNASACIQAEWNYASYRMLPNQMIAVVMEKEMLDSKAWKGKLAARFAGKIFIDFTSTNQMETVALQLIHAFGA